MVYLKQTQSTLGSKTITNCGIWEQNDNFQERRQWRHLAKENLETIRRQQN